MLNEPTSTADLREHLAWFVEKRRRVEKMLAASPPDRAELEGLVVRMLDHEEVQRDLLRDSEFYDRITPMMDEAIAALGTPNITIDQAMKWHAARGNVFAQSYLAYEDSPEYRQRSDEVEAAFAWHPAWHQTDDHTWHCDTPDDPEVWEPAKLLAQYRRAQ